MNNKIDSLYIHIPFCDHICSYCDFTKLFYSQKYEKPYLDALLFQLEQKKIDKVKTIYVGGGTPTSLSEEGLTRLVNTLSTYLDDDYEFTCEANVENLTENKLKILKDAGVNRLSIGVQSTNNSLLSEIGRHHTYEEAKKIIFLAKSMGFSNINIDLIYGFKNESLNDLKKDLENFVSLDIDHISIYSLIISKGTLLYNKSYKEQEEDESAKFYEFIVSFLETYGYEHYEVSNFARNKKYSNHNLTYWKTKEYYGVGLGASGYENGVRYTNTKNIDNYIQHKFDFESEKVTTKTLIEDFLLTNLRLRDGFSKEDFKEITSFDFDKTFSNEKLNKYVKSGDLINKNEVKLTLKGLLRMDLILRDLFDDIV